MSLIKLNWNWKQSDKRILKAMRGTKQFYLNIRFSKSKSNYLTIKIIQPIPKNENSLSGLRGFTGFESRDNAFLWKPSGVRNMNNKLIKIPAKIYQNSTSVISLRWTAKLPECKSRLLLLRAQYNELFYLLNSTI